MKIGDVIRKARESMGPPKWSQRKLAMRCGIGNSTVSRVESGQLHPDPDTLKKLAAVLPLEYEYLMRVAGYIPAEEKPVEVYTILRSHGFRREQLESIGVILNSMNPEFPLPRAVRSPALIGAAAR